MATEERQWTDAERWFREKYLKTPERDALFSTMSGEPVNPLYTAGELAKQFLEDPLRMPGHACLGRLKPPEFRSPG